MSTTSDDTLTGRLLDDRYRISDRIARGGMASVYLATDLRLDRTVAVKVMHPGLGDTDEFTARFEREARAAARLNSPSVVAVFDQGADQGLVYLVMEYVPGRTLRDVIRDEAPMSPSRALALVDPLLVALAVAHEARIIHRDVKPENVLITPDGQVKVADFGLARAVSSVTTATATGGVLIGTVSYLAPELVLNRGADARTDVYAVGAVLYELLTSAKPHPGESPIQVAYSHVHSDVPPPSATVAGVPPYVDALVARATARDRDQRSPDATVLLRQTRRVRNALDQTLDDDLELTEDLLPHRASAGSADDSEEASSRDQPPGPATDDGTTIAVPTAPVTHAVSEPPNATKPVPLPDTGPEAEDPAHTATRTRRRRGLLLLALVLVLALLAGLGGWYYGVGRFDDTPDLEGMGLQKASQRAAASGFTLDVATKTYSETVPKGTIISTAPEPGDRILPDSTIDATVSKGKERYAVPALAGKTEEQARNALTDRNLVLGEVEREYSEKVAEGEVVRARTEPETMVRRETPVDVVVSKGRRPIEVTDHTGESGTAATKRLRGAGLEPRVERTYDDEVPKGRVVEQDPDAGTLHKGNAVDLVVSEGPAPVEVPRVVGKSTEEATNILEDAGFEVRLKKERFYVGGDLVLRQSPSPGTKLQPGQTVTLRVV